MSTGATVQSVTINPWAGALRHGMAWGLGAAVLALYLATAAPNAWWGDGMELASAATVLGIAHPPGYPLYMVIAHAAIRLMPWVEPGRATTVLNAVLLAAACGMTALLLLRVIAAGAPDRDRAPHLSPAACLVAVGLAALLAVAGTVWEHATITEVYPLTYLLCLALLSVAWTAPGQRGGLRRTALLGGLLGLASLNHYSILAYYPLAGLVLLEWIWGRSRREKIQHSVVAALCWLAMLGGYLYLPLRARANPLMNWGDPQTPGRILYMLTGGEFRRLNFTEWKLPPYKGIERWLAWWVQEWVPHCPAALAAAIGAAAIGLSLIGLTLLARRRPALGIGLALAILATAFFSVTYHILDINAYFMPALPCAAVGWIEMGRALADRRRLPAWTVAALPAAALLVAIGRYPAMDKSWDVMPDLYGRQVMDALPPNAIVLADRDNSIFALWYQQIALKRRPDVTVVTPSFALHDWYGRYFESAGRPPVPIRITGGRGHDKRDYDVMMVCDVILPCFKAGHRIFSAHQDDIQIAFFAPRPVTPLPPGDAYRRIVHSDVGLPERMLYELRPNPALTSMTRIQIWNEINKVVNQEAATLSGR